MTASSISVPTTTTAELATDEVDDRHFQGVKIHGGGEGVVNELHVDDAGRLLKPSAIIGNVVPFLATASVDPYDANDIVGTPAFVEDLAVGTYAIRKMAVANAGGVALPDDLIVALIPCAPSDPVDYGDDGETFTLASAAAFFMNLIEPTVVSVGAGNLAIFEPTVETLIMGAPIQPDGNLEATDHFTLAVYAIAPTGTPATSPGLDVTIVFERVGEMLSQTAYVVTP